MEGNVRSRPDGPWRPRRDPRIYQDAGDADHSILSLEFPSPEKAKAFLNALEPVRDVSGVVQAWVLEESEAARY